VCDGRCHVGCIGVEPEEAESITEFSCPCCSRARGEPFQFRHRVRAIHELAAIGMLPPRTVEAIGPVSVEEASVEEGLACVQKMPSQVYAYLDFLEAKVF